MLEAQQREKYAKLDQKAVQFEQDLRDLRSQYAEPAADRVFDGGQRSAWNAWLQQEMRSIALQQANCLAAKELQARELKTAIGRADVVRKLARKAIGSR